MPRPQDLALDPQLRFSTRLILGPLVRSGVPIVALPADRELAQTHGVSERTVQNALQDAEGSRRARRATWSELVAGWPDLARRLPPSQRRRRRYLVLLEDEKVGAEPAPAFRKGAAGCAPRTRTPLPDVHPEPAPAFRHPACAPESSLRDDLRDEQRTYVARGPMADQITRWSARLAEEERQPGWAPAPEVWTPPLPAPSQGNPTRAASQRARRLPVEDLVAACLGPGCEAALDALLVYLATELGDTKAETRAFWARSIPLVLEAAEGYDRLVNLIVAAKGKGAPANWFSACLSRGQPGAGAKTDPRGQLTTPPGAGAKANSPLRSAPDQEYIRSVAS